MRKVFVLLAVAFVLIFAVATAMADTKDFPKCKYCGMDREKYSHSRLLIEYDDGTYVGICSVHCAAVDLAMSMDKTPKAIKVGDYNTKQLIDAEKAVWVMGGDKGGVMTKVAKWAFQKKDAANKFIKEHGGRITNFEGVMKAAYTDMYQDSKMIREKRKAMKKKMMEEGHTHDCMHNENHHCDHPDHKNNHKDHKHNHDQKQETKQEQKQDDKTHKH